MRLHFGLFNSLIFADIKEFKQMLCSQTQVETITEWLDNIADIHVLQVW